MLESPLDPSTSMRFSCVPALLALSLAACQAIGEDPLLIEPDAPQGPMAQLVAFHPAGPVDTGGFLIYRPEANGTAKLVGFYWLERYKDGSDKLTIEQARRWTIDDVTGLTADAVAKYLPVAPGMGAEGVTYQVRPAPGVSSLAGLLSHIKVITGAAPPEGAGDRNFALWSVVSEKGKVPPTRQ
ncbi:MAG: hypothetical protein R3F49_19110 [Planctomycetota bacterium]